MLLELQDLDLRIMRLNKRLDEMPEKREILAMRAKMAEVKDLLARTEAMGRAMDAKLSRFEDEVAAVTGKMEGEQAKLLSGAVKNPKELQAISMELDSLKRRRDALENEELAEMGRREAATEQEGKVRAVLQAGARKEAELVETFKQRGGALVSELEGLKSARDRVSVGLPEPMRERYEALRGEKHGIAVGVLEGNMCGACRVTLPEGDLESLVDGPEVGVCPKCRRLLVVQVDS